jgi:hypothetical protein
MRYEHVPVAVEHRWPLVAGSAGFSLGSNQGLGARAVARNIIDRGGGEAASNPIVIDDQSPVAACSSRGGNVQVVVLSDDSD